MPTIGNGRYEAAALPRLDARLFVSGLGWVGPARHITSRLRPGEFLWAPQLGPWTALALWDPNATAASLGLFDSGVAEPHTREMVEGMLELGASLPTLNFAAVGSMGNATLARLWSVLDRRLGPAPLPRPQESRCAPAPANVFAAELAYVVFNGAGNWLGEPAAP